MSSLIVWIVCMPAVCSFVSLHVSASACMCVCVCVRERTMDLLVTLQNNVSSGLLWSSVSGRQLGKLEPCADLALQLSMVAIRTGLLVSISDWQIPNLQALNLNSYRIFFSYEPYFCYAICVFKLYLETSWILMTYVEVITFQFFFLQTIPCQMIMIIITIIHTFLYCHKVVTLEAVAEQVRSC